MDAPKRNLDKLNNITTAWENLAPTKSFGGMTLAEFKTAIQPSHDTRARLSVLENQETAEKVARDNADRESLRVAQLVINGVIGDPNEGPDSDLYEAMGYVRSSARKSGLTRRKKGTQ